ncbi:YihY/virulence factor BrkB family protein [Nocardioides sp. Leaf307]|uniref:YihY/virulence factor BrkB family protein n=1 Tax=Nocardioides sp. Leaf307 TaxID=1736331 RepID=UPI000A8C3DD0|nr:YihY/virulence factor BrkB family protein [Nocardioides sp. Leaf307]
MPSTDTRPEHTEDEGLVSRVDRFQQRHKAVGLPLAVVYKYVDDAGGSLSAQITYYAFVSLFPLLLLASTILGFVLVGHPDLQERLLDSALAQLPAVGDDLQRPEGLGGGVTGIVVGLGGALYGAMGVGQAVQNAVNNAWTVPRNQRPNPIAARGRSLVLLGVIGADVLATTAVAGIVGAIDVLGPLSSVAILVGTLLIHAAAFSFVFRFATTRELERRDVLPGACVAAVAWLGLQYAGVALVGASSGGASATNGVFAVVLGLLGFLYLTSVMLVLCLELNVVLVDRLHPRTLLTPFTDNVTLTEGDVRSYTDLAKAQQLKGFQRVEVGFATEHLPDDLAEDLGDDRSSGPG